MSASAEEIKLAVIHHHQRQSLPTEVLNDISHHLLNAELRARYDAQLQAAWEQPSAAANTTAVPESAAMLEEMQVLASQKNMQEQQQELNQQQAWYRTMVGASRADYYLEQFNRLEHGIRPRFNWAAFWSGSFWFFARGMWKQGLAVTFSFIVTLVPALIVGGLLGPWGAVAILSIWLLWRLYYLPATANQRYWRFARLKIEQYRLKYQWRPQKMDKALAALTNIKIIYTIYFLMLAYVLLDITRMGILLYPTYEQVRGKVSASQTQIPK